MKFTKSMRSLIFLSVIFMLSTTLFAQNFKQQFSVSNPSSSATIDHSAWNEFLQKYIVPSSFGPEKSTINLVNYKKVSGTDKVKLDSYIKSLESVKISQYNKDAQMAYWINLYNSVTVQVILDNYPVTSIKKIKSSVLKSGPWSLELAKVEGTVLTLDNIEHDILRPIWKDARTHYAVNCASISCPNLASVAYTANNLNKMLDSGARNYINSSRAIKKDGKNYVLSSIYKWFKEDFGNNKQGVVNHLNKYLDAPLTASDSQANFKYDYDWGINEVK